jgi:hypothetical protein
MTPAGDDLDVAAGRDVGEGKHVHAAENFLVEDGRLASLDRVFIGFAGRDLGAWRAP